MVQYPHLRTLVHPYLWLFTFTLLLGGCGHSSPRRAVVAVAGDSTRQDTGRYIQRVASSGGTGRFYMGREIARVMSHRGMDWLERSNRDEEEGAQAVVPLLRLKPDAVVADLGAGSGFYTRRMARAVPQGKVYAVDIQPEMLTALEASARKAKLTNIVPQLGREANPNLPPASQDLVLLVDAYHEFHYPYEMMQAVVRSLKPGGQVVLLEFRGEDEELPIHPLHKMTEAQVVRELAVHGLMLVRKYMGLPRQHMLFFQRQP